MSLLTALLAVGAVIAKRWLGRAANKKLIRHKAQLGLILDENT